MVGWERKGEEGLGEGKGLERERERNLSEGRDRRGWLTIP